MCPFRQMQAGYILAPIGCCRLQRRLGIGNCIACKPRWLLMCVFGRCMAAPGRAALENVRQAAVLPADSHSSGCYYCSLTT